MKPQPLEIFDVALSIFNQEDIIERVLHGIFKNTTTPFNLILAFDGCTDKTKERALSYIKRAHPKLLRKFIHEDTPNLFETKANNAVLKKATSPYVISIQDDMVITEYGWERRLTFPMRVQANVFAVTARIAENIVSMGNGVEKYANGVGKEWNNLTRDTFAVRDYINRGPIVYRTDYLKQMNFLNEKYAPCALDDDEISLRAWVKHRWKVGAYWISYLSKREWSKVSDKDSTMKTWTTRDRNTTYIYNDFKDYLNSGIKHDEDINLPENEVDYIRRQPSLSERIYWLYKRPYRIDKRVMKTRKNSTIRSIAEFSKSIVVLPLSLIFGKNFKTQVAEKGIKRAIFERSDRNS